MNTDLIQIERLQREIKKVANEDECNIRTKSNAIKKMEVIVEYVDEDSEDGELENKYMDSVEDKYAISAENVVQKKKIQIV